jgi:two-component system, OmpR family, sensor kinase
MCSKVTAKRAEVATPSEETWHPSLVSSKGRLTLQELGWLLTQEASNAAERLRTGVQVMRTNAPPPSSVAPEVNAPVDASLDALDDVMKMLGSLHARPSSVRGRRGRIDLASLLWEVAPEARVAIEPGSGTEVFGDEGELRRMLSVLVGHGINLSPSSSSSSREQPSTGGGESVTIKREGDYVRIAVTLGPDSSAVAETERAWLSRMAIRYGGRHELDGATEALVLPADGVSERNEREALRKELDEARKQGEAYARELAAVFSAGEESASPSTFPPVQGANRLSLVAQMAGGVAAELRGMLFPIVRDLQALKRGAGGAGDDDGLESARRRLVHVQDFLAGLAGIGELSSDEPPIDVDFCDVARQIVRALGPRADRAEVILELVILPPGSETRAYGRCAPRAATALVRELVTQAIAASPKGSTIGLTVMAAGHAAPDGSHDGSLGTRITVDDAGAPLPSSARRQFLSLALDPGTYGRPSSLSYFICAELASAQGASLELADAPPIGRTGAGGGGLRVCVTFPK